MTPDTLEKGLLALARAYDREDASQRGEPSPWDDGADDATWRAERLACAKAGRDAYLAATARDEEAPISPLLRDNGEAEWKQIIALFFRNGIKEVPIRLRDELSTMLAWARYGERSSLKASQEAEVVKWESPEEWELEQRAFHGANNKDWPVEARTLIADLWRQYCFAAQPSPDADGDAA